jgi:hypothetical protein
MNMKKSRQEPFDVKADASMWRAEPSVRPHLVPDGKIQRCSACEHPFSTNDKPSLEASFARHVATHHRSDESSENAAKPVRGS